MRNRLPLLAALTFGVGATLFAAVLPGVRYAYRLPTLHIVLETAEGLIALVLAYLALGRFKLKQEWSNFLLAEALVLFGVTNLFLSALPRAAFTGRGLVLATWGPLVLRLTAAGILAVSAWHSGESMKRRSGSGWALIVLTIGLLAAVGAVLGVFFSDLPPGLDPTDVDSGRPRLSGEPAIVVFQVASAVLFALGAVGFIRKANRLDDDLFTWIGAASVMSAFARLNYAVFPSLYSGWVYTGDFLRFGFYLTMLIGAAREVSRYWDRVAGSATQEERRRVARDLHDGLAQELAFLSSQSKRLEKGADVDPGLLARTAERALDESRRAIAALTRDVEEPLELTLIQAAEEVASRAGALVRSDVEAGGRMDPSAREQLVRIVREAVTNAIRHGGASEVTLVLKRRPNLVLVVHDDGSGFDLADDSRSHGFGLVSMRERVEALGGTFKVTSSVGSGTQVEVEVEGL